MRRMPFGVPENGFQSAVQSASIGPQDCQTSFSRRSSWIANVSYPVRISSPACVTSSVSYQLSRRRDGRCLRPNWANGSPPSLGNVSARGIRCDLTKNPEVPVSLQTPNWPFPDFFIFSRMLSFSCVVLKAGAAYNDVGRVQCSMVNLLASTSSVLHTPTRAALPTQRALPLFHFVESSSRIACNPPRAAMVAHPAKCVK